MKPHRGTLVLVLGILGLVVCPICGIFAWIFGNADLKEMAAGTMDRSGESNTNAGKICGIVSVVLWAIGIVLYILIVALAVGGGALMQ